MAMYCYQGSSEIVQAADGLDQTLYLMNPNYYTTHETRHHTMPHAPPPQFQGIPLSHYDKPTLSTGNCSSSISISSSQSRVIMGSKYLKAAQQLLDEVANVAKTINMDHKPNIIKNNYTTTADDGGGGGGADLTTSERQEIQMKKAKLNSMSHQVEQRYTEYQAKMQVIVASFEQVAGVGSAKSYTELPLNTILKHFKRLRATISSQIKALSKSLGEEENKLMKGSRLVRFVDHHHHLQTSIGINNNNVKYFSNYDQIIAGSDSIGMLHVDNQQQQQQLGNMANSTFSLSLGLPPSQGAHQHSFITRINGVDHNQPHHFLPDFNWWRQRF